MQITIVDGNLLEQPVDCIVNAWNRNIIPISTSVVNAMKLAEESGFQSIAFPVLGAGSGRFNAAQAEEIMRKTFADLHSQIAVTLVRYKE
jgi:O-acetyl-ADP-ribose deacetylase (regulator of RNase III)